MFGLGATRVQMKTCGHSSCNTIIVSTSQFCNKHGATTSTKTEEPIPTVLTSPTPDEATSDMKLAHHINRRKGHEKIMLDLLKRKIVRKGILQAQAPTEDKGQDDKNDQDNDTAKT